MDEQMTATSRWNSKSMTPTSPWCVPPWKLIRHWATLDESRAWQCQVKKKKKQALHFFDDSV